MVYDFFARPSLDFLAAFLTSDTLITRANIAEAVSFAILN